MVVVNVDVQSSLPSPSLSYPKPAFDPRGKYRDRARDCTKGPDEHGPLAQLVARMLCMSCVHKVRGSIPLVSIYFLVL